MIAVRRRGGVRLGEAVLVALSVVSFLALSLIVFYRHEAVLFLRNDGFYQLVLNRNQLDWMGLRPLLTTDFLKAQGEFWFPTLTRLSPGFVIGNWLGGAQHVPMVAYTVFALQLFAATAVAAICLGMRASLAVVAAWLACLLTLPYFVPTLTYIRLWGNPNFTTSIFGAVVTIGLFYLLGRSRPGRDYAIVAAIFALLSFCIVTQSVVFAMAGPVTAIFALGLVLTADSRRERRRKLAFGGAAAVALAVLFLPYLYELFALSKVTYFWQELERVPVTFRDVSFFTHRHEEAGVFGAVVLAAAAASGVALLLFGRGPVRRIAAAYVGYLALQSLLVLWIVWRGGIWQGPPPGHFDLIALPFHALFIVLGATYVGYGLAEVVRVLTPGWYELDWDTRAWGRPALVLGAVLLLVPWAAVDASRVNAGRLTDHRPWPWPPTKPPVVVYLEAETALTDGAPFRGRVANLAGAEGIQSVMFLNQHVYDHAVLHQTGNGHRQYGFWYFNIPTLMSGTQFTSPFFYAVSSRFLKRPHTPSMRAHMAMETFNGRVMAALGTRFVIDDAPIPDAGRLVMRHQMPTGVYYHVYEIAEPNLTGYSPTEVRIARDARSTLAEMARPAVDFRRQVIVETPLPEGLVAATASRLDVRRGGLWLEARSDGTSVLVLPLEYSHCLRADFAADAPVRLFRANLNQTGVLFSGAIDGTIVHRFGAFAGRGCRLRDLGDAERLDLGAVAGWWPGDG